MEVGACGADGERAGLGRNDHAINGNDVVLIEGEDGLAVEFDLDDAAALVASEGAGERAGHGFVFGAGDGERERTITDILAERPDEFEGDGLVDECFTEVGGDGELEVGGERGLDNFDGNRGGGVGAAADGEGDWGELEGADALGRKRVDVRKVDVDVGGDATVDDHCHRGGGILRAAIGDVEVFERGEVGRLDIARAGDGDGEIGSVAEVKFGRDDNADGDCVLLGAGDGREEQRDGREGGEEAEEDGRAMGHHQSLGTGTGRTRWRMMRSRICLSRRS